MPRSKPATVAKTSAEWIEIFNKAGVPCGPIYSIDQVFADAQVKHLGIAQRCDEAERRARRRSSASRSRCRARRARSSRAPPDRGEHTDEVFEEFGFCDDEIAALHEAKAV